MPRFLDLVHHWIVEVDLVETLANKEESKKRDDMNDELIGTLVQAPVIVVQGVEIARPNWFRETDVNIDQMMAQMGNRRNR